MEDVEIVDAELVARSNLLQRAPVVFVCLLLPVQTILTRLTGSSQVQ